MDSTLSITQSAAQLNPPRHDAPPRRMVVGLLWFDDDQQRNLQQKVERAAQRHLDKYGTIPDLVTINPKTINDGQRQIVVTLNLGQGNWEMHTLIVKQTRSILPNHFWLGVTEAA